MKENGHFVAYLNDGFRFDFNEQCNAVDYSDNNVLVFKHYYDDKNYRTLAVIPYSSIKHVLSVVKEDEEGE